MSFVRNYRYIIAFSLWIYQMTVSGVGFIDMSIGLVCMVNRGSARHGCQNADFKWSANAQSALLAGYNVGGILAVLPAGVLISRYGQRIVLILGAALATVCSGFVPMAALQNGWVAVMILRIGTGISAAITWPAVSATVAVWFPPSEQAVALGFLLSASPFGEFLMAVGGGVICCTAGWQYVFYLSATVNFVSLVIVVLKLYSTPESCGAYLTSEESALLSLNTPVAGGLLGVKEHIPWKRMLTSPCVIAILTCSFVYRMSQEFSTMIMPLYMRDVFSTLQWKIGMYLGLPILIECIARIGSGSLARLAYNRFGNATLVAKVFNSVAFLSIAVTLTVILFVKDGNTYLIVISLLAKYTMETLVIGGFLKSGIDMSPRYTGIIYAMKMFTAYLSSVMLPFIVQALLNQDEIHKSWNHVLMLMIGLSCLAAAVFSVLGSSKVQPWNHPLLLDEQTPLHDFR